MRIRATVAALALSLGSAVARPPAPTPVDDHTDRAFGFELRIPRGYETQPLAADELWIKGKYAASSPQRESYTIEGYTRTKTLYPEMWVIVFPNEDLFEEEEAQREQTSTGEIDFSDETEERLFYRDYLDFLQKRYQSGGWFQAEDAVETEVDGVPATIYEISFPGDAPEWMTTWVYHTDLGDVAVQFKYLESEQSDMQSDMRRTFRSFERIERTEPLRLRKSKVLFSFFEWLDLEPRDRKIRRQEYEQLQWERLQSSLPDDWETMVIDDVYVATHADRRHAEDVVEQILAVMEWLDDYFPDIGKGEYVRRPIVRICADEAEKDNFFRSRTFGDFDPIDINIVTHKSTLGQDSPEWGYVKRRAMEIWFQDRDYRLFFIMPHWLRNGLQWMFRSASIKRGDLDFDAWIYERQLMREAESKGEYRDLRTLMQLTEDDFERFHGDRNYYPSLQCGSLVRFLITGEGRRNRSTRKILPEYLENLLAVREEAGADDPDESAEEEEDQDEDAPKTAAEEDELARERKRAERERREFVAQETFRRTFADFDDRDWKRFEDAYYESIF